MYDANAIIGTVAGDIRDELHHELVPDGSPKGDAMHWTSNVNLLFDPLRELAAHGSDAVLRDVLNEGTPEITENKYDNWNGGTTYFTLTVSVPPHIFIRIEKGLEALEKKILERVTNLT